MPTDTPKTDAIIQKADDLAFAREAWDVLCKHARELERENARLVRSRDRVKQDRDAYMKLYRQARAALPASWSPSA